MTKSKVSNLKKKKFLIKKIFKVPKSFLEKLGKTYFKRNLTYQRTLLNEAERKVYKYMEGRSQRFAFKFA